MKKKVLLVLSYVLVAALACGATLGIVYYGTGYSKLDELENLIFLRFAGDADQTAMEDAAAYAMVDALGDRWSYYIPAADFDAFQDNANNAYVGIGVSVTALEDGTGFLVAKVEPGGPADQGGMEVGDIIIQVEDQSVGGLTVSELSKRIKGEENTSVTITVLREGEGISLYLTRKRVQTAVARGSMLNEHVGLVTITNFDERCADETISAIQKVLDQGADMLLFDVRNNPGGYVDELCRVLDYLLPEGNLIRMVGTDEKEETKTSDETCVKVPMAVLVNADSYSAAELFAADLREYGVAKIFGEQTCGKGFYQNLFQFQDGSAVGLSIGRYYTSKGENLEGVGLTPDVEVKLNDTEKAQLLGGLLEAEKDPQIQEALNYLMDKVVKP